MSQTISFTWVKNAVDDTRIHIKVVEKLTSQPRRTIFSGYITLEDYGNAVSGLPVECFQTADTFVSKKD